MKKISIISILVFLSLVLISANAFAISGACVNCHTMHNSQNGTRMADRDAPYSYLLRASCIGCHTGPVSVAYPYRQNSFGAPIVLGTVAPGGQGGTSTLAGGDFWWVATGTPGRDDTMGHNVEGLAPADTTITTPNGYTPPGWDLTATPGALIDGTINNGVATWTAAGQLKCAGQFGCHGNHNSSTNDGGIMGAHHGNTGLTATKAEAPTTATTIGNSYRFLGGIQGKEYVSWNYGETSANHNEYYGVNGNVAYANKRTINYSCAQCHGVFHNNIGTASPWLRHPTDVDLPATGEYVSYNPDNANVYSVEAPVARSTVYVASSSVVTPGVTTIVMCISCHRAHGSPQPDILRWTYSSMIAGVGGAHTGCFTCHTAKN